MYTIKETIIVEGIYDKIKLSGFIDSLIFVTNGFGVFNDKKMQESIRTFAKKTGIVILTDSDHAGMKIRSFVKQLADETCVKHAYIPEICGKERRKTVGGKEGLLGVEGISEPVIMDALIKSGCSVDGKTEQCEKRQELTKNDFYMLGLCGGKNSSELRRRLADAIGLPSKLSANMLIKAASRLLDKNELVKLVENIKNV